MERGYAARGQPMPPDVRAPRGMPAGVFNSKQRYRDMVDQQLLDPNRNPAVRRAAGGGPPRPLAPPGQLPADADPFADASTTPEQTILDDWTASQTDDSSRQNPGVVLPAENFFDTSSGPGSINQMRATFEKTPEGRAMLHQFDQKMKAFSDELSKMLAHINDADITEEELVTRAQQLPSYHQNIATDAAMLVKQNLPKAVLETRKKERVLKEKQVAVEKERTDTNIRTIQNLPPGRYTEEEKAELEFTLQQGGQLDSDTLDEIIFNGGEVLDKVTGKPIRMTREGERRLKKEEADADKAAEKSAAQDEDQFTAAKMNQANPGFTHYKDAANGKWIQVDADGVKSAYTGVTAEKPAPTPAETKAQTAHVEAVDKVSTVKDDRESGPPRPEEGNFLINKDGEHGWFTQDEWDDLTETKGADDWREATPDRIWHQFEKPIAKKGFDKTFEKSTDEEKAYGRALFNANMDKRGGGVKAIAAYKHLKRKEFAVVHKKYDAFLKQREHLHPDDQDVEFKDDPVWADAKAALEQAETMGDEDYQEMFRRDRQELYDLAAKAGSAR